MSKKLRKRKKGPRPSGAGALIRQAENTPTMGDPPDDRPAQAAEVQNEPRTPVAEPVPAPTREHRGRTRHFVVEVVRFALAVVVLLVLQLIFEKVVFLKIHEESEFKQEVVEALELLEPIELVKLWREASTNYEEPIAETPEYATCLKRTPDGDCAAEARQRRNFVKVPAEKYGGMVAPNDPTWKPLIGAGRVLAYLYFSAQTDGQRFVAVLQLIVGFAASCVAALLYFQRVRTHHAPDDVKHAVPIILILLVGTLVGASVLAYPIRLLGLIAFGFITGTMVRC